MILHDIFRHLLFSTSLSLSWCRWGHRWAGTLGLSSPNDSNIHFLSLGRTSQIQEMLIWYPLCFWWGLEWNSVVFWWHSLSFTGFVEA
jgi:hypothetical protein